MHRTTVGRVSFLSVLASRLLISRFGEFAPPLFLSRDDRMHPGHWTNDRDPNVTAQQSKEYLEIRSKAKVSGVPYLLFRRGFSATKRSLRKAAGIPNAPGPVWTSYLATEPTNDATRHCNRICQCQQHQCRCTHSPPEPHGRVGENFSDSERCALQRERGDTRQETNASRSGV